MGIIIQLILFIVTLYSAVAVVIFSENAQGIMNIIGSSFYSLVCFIFPSMFYLRIYKENISTSKKCIHWGMLIMSSGFMVWNTALNILEAAGVAGCERVFFVQIK